jgi:hypothetical protein
MTNENLSKKQFGVSVPEYVQKYISGGMGHLEGDESRSIVGMVPTSVMKRFREFDRTNTSESTGERSAGVIEGIKNDIANGGGIHEPIVLDYNHETGMGHISEGNHRLAAAMAANVSHVPVRVYRGNRTGKNEAPLTLTNDFGDKHGYVPSQMHPHHFAELKG